MEIIIAETVMGPVKIAALNNATTVSSTVLYNKFSNMNLYELYTVCCCVSISLDCQTTTKFTERITPTVLQTLNALL